MNETYSYYGQGQDFEDIDQAYYPDDLNLSQERQMGTPTQPYPGQPYPGQPYPMQPYPMQPYPAQHYPTQPYPMHPYPTHLSYPSVPPYYPGGRPRPPYWHGPGTPWPSGMPRPY